MSLHCSLLALLLYLSEFHCLAFQCSTSPPSRQTPEYTVCATGNQTDQPHNEVVFADECRYLFSPPLAPCHPDTSPSSLCWRTLDANGTVELALPLLPQRCHYTSYEAYLMVYETSDQDCFPHRFDLKMHSRKRVCVVECLEPSCLDRCIQRGLLTFRHVFSGCYQLTLTPYHNQQPYIHHQLESAPSYLNTGHIKTPIQSDSVFITNVIPTRFSLQAKFSTNPTSSRFKLMRGVDTSLGADACRKTGTCVATCDTTLESPHIQCNSDARRSSNVSCNYQSESVISCEFSQLKAGNYCVRLTFDDDRCDRNTIWDNNDYNFSMCTWQTHIFEILPAESTGIEGHSPGPISSVLLSLLILVILVSCGIIWWTLHHRIDTHDHKFSPIVTITSQVPERPRVLLLYARDCPTFMEAVAQLRTVLKRGCDCEVMDCWEDNQFQNIAQGPTHWLMSLLSDSKVRTVLVTSPASVLLESCLVNGSRVCYQQPKAFDSVVTQALTSLHETYSHEAYKSLYVLRLDSRIAGMTPQAMTYLNPLTTYELPVHLNALLANLQNMNPTECRIPDDIESDVIALTEAVSQYRRYLSENPRYLDSLLATDNGSTVHHALG